MSDPTAKPFHGSTSGAPSNASVSVTTTGNSSGQVPIANSGGGISWNYSPAYDSGITWGTAAIKLPSPAMTEQKFDNLSRAQALSLLLFLTENKSAYKLVSGLVGCFEVPTRDNIIHVLNWIDPDKSGPRVTGELTAVSLVHYMNGIQSIANLLRAVADDLSSIVKEGRALKVEEITQ